MLYVEIKILTLLNITSNGHFQAFFVFIKLSGTGDQPRFLDEIFYQNFRNQMFYQLTKFHDESSSSL